MLQIFVLMIIAVLSLVMGFCIGCDYKSNDFMRVYKVIIKHVPQDAKQAIIKELNTMKEKTV